MLMNMDKICIAVISGGPSSEYEVSIKSGQKVADGLDKEIYEPIPVRVDRSGIWEIEPKEIRDSALCSFIAMHGTYGEDGTVQSICEQHNMPYTGSDSLASALGMNKFLSLRLFRDAGLTVPATLLVAQKEWIRDSSSVLTKAEHNIGYPLVVKPNDQGSSVGVYIVKDKNELHNALSNTLGFYRNVLVQEFISGREFTCGVMDHGWHGSAFPLLPTEIIPRVSAFFDYKAKYNDGGSFEVTPPENLSGQNIKKIRDIALSAHNVLGASGFSRTDIIMDKHGKMFVLEINTIPGLTEESLIPKEASAIGMSFSRFLETIIKAGMTRYHIKKDSKKR